MTQKFKIRLMAFLELIRLKKTAVTAPFTLLGAYIVAYPGEPWPTKVFTGATVVCLITAFGFAINDYCNVKEDTIGKPQRPIPSGRVSSSLAGAFAWSLAVMGVLTSAFLSVNMMLFAIAMVGITAAYSYRLKNSVILGNVAVAVPVSAVPLYGALAMGRVTAGVLVVSAIMFLYVLAQEALFNLEDEECDRLAGLRTTATYLGPDRTIMLIRAVLITAMAVTLVPWSLGLASTMYLGMLVACVLVPITLMIFILRQPISRPVIAKMATLSRLLWVTSLVPFALLK